MSTSTPTSASPSSASPPQAQIIRRTAAAPTPTSEPSQVQEPVTQTPARVPQLPEVTVAPIPPNETIDTPEYDFFAEEEALLKDNAGGIDGTQGEANSNIGTKGEQEAPEDEDLGEIYIPEGVEIDENSPITSKFVELLQKNKLSTGIGQQLIDLHIDALKENHDRVGIRFKEDLETRIAGMKSQWAEDLKNDPEIGGQNLKITEQRARAALKAYDKDGSFVALMKSLGAQNHPAVARLLANAGRKYVAGAVLNGAGRQGTPMAPQAPRMGYMDAFASDKRFSF